MRFRIHPALQEMMQAPMFHSTIMACASSKIIYKELSSSEKAVQVKGLSHGYHGFHVHTYGSVYRADVGEGRCVASGGHYDPLSATHGNINDTNRHVGDLGNICANEDGEAVDVFVDSDSSLTGTNPIRGRAIVIHAGPDDFTSQPSGDSGSRVGCCIIGQSQSWIPSEISFGYTDSSISIVRSQVVEMAMVGVFLIVLKFMV
ncbi:superoxide dismutase [Cu-Zn]-like isoform X4 [Symsagittifera roscoffensis]|uniref:superoxide dismutase [Cu-Zn]-like isoform X4 n=1 Tax=Symsagittifera roscoffensis TaxID=84072 RepID=UPI00307B8B63